MIIREARFSGDADAQAMAALSRAARAGHLHVTDLPYRFSSWAFDEPDNARLWSDADGRLLAWAVMQTPFWTIDYAIHPGAEGELHPRVLAWADGRARAVLDTASGRPSWFVNVFAGQAGRIRDLEAAGFACQSDVGEDSWSKVFMRRQSSEPAPDLSLPAGFVIRPLAGDGEVEAYVDLHRAVFESRNMTVAWRARTLRRPEYVPDLDLVAVAPDGRLAAFCVGWLDRDAGEVVGQVEPLGARADFRRLGLGRAVLSECLRRMRGFGARRVFVETDNYRNAALDLYESAGFRAIRDVLVYRRDYGGVTGG
jgi:ribosomal protein S18 acetylase RimI-like enzyme